MAINKGLLNVNAFPTKRALASNYLNFTDASSDWSQQYLPELYEQEVERYGNRSVSSFLRMVGAEMPMASDQVVWSEQGRLHLSYGTANDNTAIVQDADLGVIRIAAGHAIRLGQLVVISDGTTTTKGYVSGVNVNGTDITVLPYDAANLDTNYNDATQIKLFVFGSEFKKGDVGMQGDTLSPTFTTFTNKPVIIKDKFEISGSDASQIGWVEVSGEAGESGYLWYIKAEGETRTRFEDYLEMTLVEAEKGAASNTVDTALGSTADVGTEGLFAAIESRGHTATMFDGDAAASGQDIKDLITKLDAQGAIEENMFFLNRERNSAIESRGHTATMFDGDAAASGQDIKDLITKLDAQGAIEENMFFLNRERNLAIDDYLAAQNSYGASGTSYGVFENSEDMALNLGFSGFRRGSYDFYKSDWKYLNDGQTRGFIDDIKGVMVPAGTSSVYDQALGKNIRRPFLHVRYRASEADDRRMKSWITGSVGGASTSSLDAMEVHYLSERCLVVQAANNFVLFNA